MRIVSIIIVCLVFTACGAQKTAQQSALAPNETELQSENERTRACFEKYKSAILNDRGAEAAEYVDSRTISYYQEILEKTKNADSTEVNSLNIMDKLMVFSIRHRTVKEDILKFDGKQLLVHAIQEGMVGKSSVVNNEIGEIDLAGDFAKGQLISSGTPVPMYFHFYKEQDSWKINLTSIFPVANQAFQKMADDSGQDENEYLFMLLEVITGNKPTSQIWKPVK